MQLMRLAEAPLTDRDNVFLYSRARALAGASLLLLAAAGITCVSWLKQAWLGYYVSAVILISLLIYHKAITARFRPTNWLLRMTDNGLLVKFRSYLNCHFPAEDLAVVFIPFGEIRSVNRRRETQELPDRDDGGRSSTTIRVRKLVELELAGDSAPLAKELANERERVFRRGSGPSTRYHDFPVRLVSPDRLQIHWTVVPSAQNFLAALTRHTLVRPAKDFLTDFGNLAALSREEQEARLHELAATGDMIGAVALARKLYSYDLATAKTFVEGLAGKGDQS